MSNNTADESRERLVKLLRDLFQFDVADLDFGIYKIMNQRREEIEKFIERDLISKTETAFRQYLGTSTDVLKAVLEEMKVGINKDFGAGTVGENGEITKNKDSPKIIEYLAKKEELRTAELTTGQIKDVYNHVYEFFSRYFDKGDFFSKRRYGGKDKYVIPYNGEEVMLHWTNKDQYYVKTGEHFTNYEFKMDDWTLRFVLVHVEVEQNNLKGKDRFFTLSEKTAPEIDENKRVLTISFQYRELTDEEDKRLTKGKRQEQLTKATLEKILKSVAGSPVKPILLKLVPMGEDASKKFIEKHLDMYVKKNTTDYFIHKDLKGFLTRELDFFIKNEIIQVDELVDMSEGAIRQNMARVKAIYGICTPIIEFLGQIEDFQKMLFEKKKFVLRTEYCMTLDHVPKELYPEIAANRAQVAEWKRLFNLDEYTKNKLRNSIGKDTLNIEFLDEYKYLVLDTKYFSLDFKDRLLESIKEIDQTIHGVLICSENYHALNLIMSSFYAQVGCIYLDPPYNTGSDGFPYKDSYQHSSWLTMLNDRIMLCRELLRDIGVMLVSIDENEHKNLLLLFSDVFGEKNRIGEIIWKAGAKNDQKYLDFSHEYIICYTKQKEALDLLPIRWLERKEGIDDIYAEHERIKKKLGTDYAKISSQLKLFYRNLPDSAPAKVHSHYNWVDEKGIYFAGDLSKPEKGYYYDILHPTTKQPCKKPAGGWRFIEETMKQKILENSIHFGPDHTTIPNNKVYLRESEFQSLASVIYKDNRAASLLIKQMFGEKIYKNPKDPELLNRLFKSVTSNQEMYLDCFAGSGTTAQAIITLNATDNGNRKYILVEMEEYFDTLMKPRIQKLLFSKDWSDGTPSSDLGHSHIFKCIYLEQYEDTLSNIVFRSKSKTIQETLQTYDDYFLRYMLDYETRDSPARLTVSEFENPFDYKIKTVSGGEERVEPVDLVETFNYLLGLRVERLLAAHEGERYYKAVRGKKRDGRSLLVVWRRTEGIDLKRDKEFIEKEFLKDWMPDIIYVNGMCHVKGAQSIEPEFKKLMGA